MRAILLVALLLAPLAAPGRAAAQCTTPLVPVYPGALPAGGPVGSDASGFAASVGHTVWATPEPLRDVQMFYYIRLLGSGWGEVAQLPGQYPDQFGGTDRGPIITTLSVLEFVRDDGRQRVRIAGEAGGYSVWLECRDR
jgi:hypothetical protein